MTCVREKRTLASFNVLYYRRPDFSEDPVPTERTFDFGGHRQLVGCEFGAAVDAFIE